MKPSSFLLSSPLASSFLFGGLLSAFVFACGGEPKPAETPASTQNAEHSKNDSEAVTKTPLTAPRKQEDDSATYKSFSAKDTKGKTLKLSDYAGKNVVLLNFWSTFCEPCMAEFPHIERMYKTYKGKNFVVIGIAIDGPETSANVPAFVSRNGLSFPVVLDEDSQIVGMYNPKRSAPFSVLMSKEGRIVKTHEGYNPGDEEILEKEIQELVK